MKLKIKLASLVPDQYGKHIKITQVQLLNDDGSYVKAISLNEATLSFIKEHVIDLPEGFDTSIWTGK